VTGPNDLLLAHFRSWAEAKGVTADLDLLDQLLTLRKAYDDLEPTYWPEGSVTHLLLERWPAKGSVDPPDESTLTDSLDAWFRFLRNTGRMSGRSAQPKDLAREARRAAPRMSEASADRTQWSQTKLMMDFGATLGIDFDHVQDLESMQQRLDATQAAWNALPMHERLMPDHEPRDETLRERIARNMGTDDPLVGLLMSFWHELPTGTLPTPDVTGPQFARAPYVRQVLALADWARDGQPLTDTDVLRLAPSRDAYAVLGLDAWTRAQLAREYPDDRRPGVAAVGHVQWIEDLATKPWRSAADCVALDRLWWGGLASGVLAIRGRTVYGVPAGDRSDDDWLQLGVTACAGLLEWLENRPGQLMIVVQALMRSYVTERSWIGFAELADFYEAWLFRPSFREVYQREDDLDVRVALGHVADTGLLEERPDEVRLTEAGDVFVTWRLKLMEEPR